MKSKHIYLVVFIFNSFVIQAQTILTKQRAIKYLLANNLDIKVSKNSNEVAVNTAHFLNSGYLPSVSSNTNTTFNNNDITSTVLGEDRKLSGVETDRLSTNMSVNYLLFNGFRRQNAFKRFKEEKGLSDIETEEIISNTVLQFYSIYFQLAFQYLKLENQNRSLKISKSRLEKEKVKYDYGQATRLSYLNAKVDFDNDSIAFLTEKQLYINTKRDLNLLLNKELDIEYEIDTIVNFLPEQIVNNYYVNSEEGNYVTQKLKSGFSIEDLKFKEVKSIFFPTISLNFNYAWSLNNNPPTNRITTSTVLGISYGASLVWNLFDGGTAMTSFENAKINYENQALSREKLMNDTKNSIQVAYDNYVNQKEIYKARRQNEELNEVNFLRSKENYKSRLITAIEFRQAQLNYITAKNNCANAKFSVKMAEMQILHLSGKLLNNAIN